jgi:hypothetical protein
MKELKSIPFASSTTPWRVVIPARFAPEAKRQVKYFKTKKAADDFCTAFNRKGPAMLNGYVAPAPKFEQDANQALFNELLKKVGGERSELYNAVERYQRTMLAIKPATVSEAIERFLEYRKTVRKRNGQPLDRKTIESDRDRLRKVWNAFTYLPLADLNPIMLREFFDGTGKNERSIYKSVRLFFNWAVEYGYLAENPMLKIKPRGEFGMNTEIYPVRIFEQVLRIAAGIDAVKAGGKPTTEFLPLLAWFTLSGFLGLRSTEAFRENRDADAIRWDDLYLDRGAESFVDIREEVAKLTPRTFNSRSISTSVYLEAARSWLALVPRETPFIVRWTKRQIQELKRDFTKATGGDLCTEPEWRGRRW